MSIIPRNASATRPKPFASDDEMPVRECGTESIGGGLGVFRALFFMLALYVGLGSLVWFAWYAWHWHSR